MKFEKLNWAGLFLFGAVIPNAIALYVIINVELNSNIPSIKISELITLIKRDLGLSK